jgi:hypothetical protein
LTISPEAKKKTQRNGHAAQEESHSQTRGPWWPWNRSPVYMPLGQF